MIKCIGVAHLIAPLTYVGRALLSTYLIEVKRWPLNENSYSLITHALHRVSNVFSKSEIDVSSKSKSNDDTGILGNRFAKESM